MEFVYHDGGRSKWFKGYARDCVTRAIAIAEGRPYIEVYDELQEMQSKRIVLYNGNRSRSVRNGTDKRVERKYLLARGWKWVPTMFVGQGCKVHLRKNELPSGVILVSVSKHLVAVINGVIYDTYDCSRDETRCVYGYYTK